MKYLLAIALAVVLVACGGGGGSSSTSSSGSGSGPVTPSVNPNINVAAINVNSSASSLNADGSSLVTFTISALTSGNASISGAVIDLAATNGVVLSKSSVVTTDAGATVTMIASSSDQTKRISTLTASCSGCSATPSTVQISINGASIQLSSSVSSIIAGGSGTVLTSNIRDIYGKGMQNVNVSFAATDPAILGLSSPSAVTDSSGVAQVTVTGLKAGSSSINVSALGNANSQAYTSGVAASQLVVNSPANKTPIQVNNPQTITVAAPGANNVTFSTTLGTVGGVASKMVSVINGVASIDFQSVNAGTASISMSDDVSPPRTANLILIVSPLVSDANKILLNASQTSLPISIAGSQSSIKLTARAIKYDGTTDQSVANVPILFSMVGGPGAGEFLAPALVYTDATGNAVATFTAGASASITNGITISASIQNSSVKTGTLPSNNSAVITIGGKALSVAFGAATVVGANQDGTLYTMAYGVQVTDANNNPVPDQVVTLHMRPVAFSTGGACIIKATYCSEDFNGNGSLDAGEDGVRVTVSDTLSGLQTSCLNQSAPLGGPFGTYDKALTPQNSDGGSVPSTVTTDQNGYATFTHTYLKSSALWVVNRLTATVSSNGTESSNSTIFRLAPSTTDVGPPCHLPDSSYQY